MNNGFKFRAWDKERNKFFYSKDFLSLFTFFRKIDRNNINSNLYLQEFTGLLDTNEQEIYEGDILTYGKTYPSYICEYSDRIGSFTIGGHLINTNEGRYVNTNSLKVIGNIFENPNLLTVKE